MLLLSHLVLSMHQLWASRCPGCRSHSGQDRADLAAVTIYQRPGVFIEIQPGDFQKNGPPQTQGVWHLTKDRGAFCLSALSTTLAVAVRVMCRTWVGSTAGS